MIVDQLFTPKLISEGEVYDLGREYGAPAPAKKPRSQNDGDHNPYPFSKEEDEDYFREIFRKKREAAKAKDQGVAEGANDELGNAIIKYFGQIYDQGDDGLDYLDANAPVFSEVWSNYEGDLDSIIAEVDPSVLQKIAFELKRVASELQDGEQGLAEGSDDKEPFDYAKWKASNVKPRKPRGYKDAEAIGQQQREIDRQRKERKQQGVAEGLTYAQKHSSWSVQSPKKNEFNTRYKLDQEKEARAHAERIGGKLVKVDQHGAAIRKGSKGDKGVSEGQLDEVDWKAWQDKMKAAGKGAKEFTKNVRDTGNAAAGMINAYGGAGKELGRQLIARPTGAVYNATKSGLSKAADVAKSTYGDVKQGVQNVGQAVSTVGTDVGQGLQKVGRGAANVAGGTAGALGAVAGGATTGLGRAGVKGFNTGVQNVGGDAVDRAETNIFKPKSDPAVIKQQIDTKKQEIADLEAQLKVSSSGMVQKQMPFYGTNPNTGRPWTYDELQAQANAGATSTAPAPTAPAPKPTVAPSVGFTPTNVTYGPGFGGNYYKQKAKPTQAQKDAYQKAIGAPTLPEARIATVLKKPVAEMLQMVETKEDVLRIKQFVDETFVKYGAVNESAFEVRNQILEHVTQVGAQRRREHARKSR